MKQQATFLMLAKTFKGLEEVLSGFYSIDFFCDGNLIGSFPFQLKK